MGGDKKALEFSRYLHDLMQGKDVTAWLSRNPGTAKENESLGHIALALKSMQPDEENLKLIESRSLRRFLDAAKSKKSLNTSLPTSDKRRVFWLRVAALQRAVLVVILALFCLSSIGGGMVYASSTSLPGDPLYAVKLAHENALRFFTRNVENRIALEERFTNQRLLEVTTVLKNEREVAVYFDGVLYDLQPDRWVVDYLVVQVPPTTPIEGNPIIGDYVEVWAKTAAQQHLIATAVKVQGQYIRGPVKTIDNNILTVDGITIATNPLGHDIPPVQVGDMVSIHTRDLPTGESYVLYIERDGEVNSSTYQIEINGLVESQDETQWRVAGYTISITPQTALTDNIKPGDEVVVHAIRLLDGRIIAIEIEYVSNFRKTPVEDDDVDIEHQTRPELDQETESEIKSPEVELEDLGNGAEDHEEESNSSPTHDEDLSSEYTDDEIGSEDKHHSGEDESDSSTDDSNEEHDDETETHGSEDHDNEHNSDQDRTESGENKDSDNY